MRAKAKRRWTHEMPMNVNLFAARTKANIERRERKKESESEGTWAAKVNINYSALNVNEHAFIVAR